MKTDIIYSYLVIRQHSIELLFLTYLYYGVNSNKNEYTYHTSVFDAVRFDKKKALSLADKMNGTSIKINEHLVTEVFVRNATGIDREWT